MLECPHFSSVDKVIKNKTEEEKWCLFMQGLHADNNCSAHVGSRKIAAGTKD